MTHTAVLSLGSNWGDREKAVSDALSLIQRQLGETVHSDIYFTPAVNGKGPDYANCVAAVYTPLDIDLVIFDGDVLRPADFTRKYFYRGLLQISQQTEYSTYKL